jgi:hypothetical protein
MSIEKQIKQYFPHFRFIVSGITIFLLIFIVLHIFTRTFGGPFPQRLRGPFAREEQYKLGVMPEWENAIKMTESGKTTSELLLEGHGSTMPKIQFGNPPKSATPEIQ